MAKIVLITHQKGGVGKSTITFNLAQNLKEAAKVAIIDFDRQGSLIQVSDVTQGIDIIPYTGKKVKDILKLPYDFIFIDTPPYLVDNLPELCNIADLVIIPTKPSILDLFAIKGTIDIINSVKNLDKAVVLFNMVKPNTSLTEDIVNAIADFNVQSFKTMISDLVVYSRSVLVNGVDGHNKAQKQVDDLTKEVLTKLTKGV